MFEHIVLLKFKPDVSIEAKESAIKRAHDFKRNIPGIVELSVGINVTEEIEHMQGFTLGIRVTFEDQQACRDYIQHPCIKVYCNPSARLLKESSLWITRLLNVPFITH